MNEWGIQEYLYAYSLLSRAKNKVEPGLTITSGDTPPTRLFAQPGFSITLCCPSCSNNNNKKLWHACFVTPGASCEGPRCTPSLSLHVPTTTNSCSGQSTKTTNGFTRTEERHSLSPIQ